MNETLKLVLVVILTIGLASCQAQQESEIIDENQDSTFTLNGAGE